MPITPAPDDSLSDPSQELRILVPIRDPLSKQSTHTVRYATELARDADSVAVFVLHVDLFQTGSQTTTQEIARAITPLLDEFPVAIITSSGFLLEEIILEEATQLHVDVIVLGENQRPFWRRALGRLFGSGPDIAAFLEDHAEARVERAA